MTKTNSTKSPAKPWWHIAWREVLLPVLYALALVAIVVALIEGPALDTFLYAVF